MTFLSLVIISAACLVFPSTRICGVLGAGALVIVYPYETTGLLLLVLPLAYLYHHHRRRKSDGL